MFHRTITTYSYRYALFDACPKPEGLEFFEFVDKNANYGSVCTVVHLDWNDLGRPLYEPGITRAVGLIYASHSQPKSLCCCQAILWIRYH